MNTKVTLLAGLLVLGATQPAVGQRFVPGSLSPTAVSGVRSSQTLVGASGQSALYGIAWEEMGNTPNRFWLMERRLANGRALSESSRICTASSCGETPYSSNKREVDFRGNPRYFVRGIAVCVIRNTWGIDRLKGIRLYAAKVPPNGGPVEALNATEQESRFNCLGRWRDPVFCPSGSVAWGLVLHGRAVGGIALRCKEVTWP